MRTKRVYIAAPYTDPDPVINTREAVMAGEEVLRQTTDWVPFVPHLFHLWHLISPHPYPFWMQMDGDWMLACQALIRRGGPSKGADEDMGLAVSLGIPVFLTLDEFVAWAKED